jgi:hypothetical protein
MARGLTPETQARFYRAYPGVHKDRRRCAHLTRDIMEAKPALKMRRDDLESELIEIIESLVVSIFE